MATCFIVGAGEFTPRELQPQEGDLLIAADAGLRWLESVRLKPDLLVGDFDSLGTPPSDLPTRTFPVEKDDTDVGLAIRIGLEKGYRSFVLYGGGGGREDHFIANLQTVAALSRQGCEARMVCPNCVIFGLTDGTLTLPERETGTLASVFCHGEKAEGVTLCGMKYPLNNATLTCDYPLGVSNHYAERRPSVTVKRGTLAVFVYDRED